MVACVRLFIFHFGIFDGDSHTPLAPRECNQHCQIRDVCFPFIPIESYQNQEKLLQDRSFYDFGSYILIQPFKDSSDDCEQFLCPGSVKPLTHSAEQFTLKLIDSPPEGTETKASEDKRRQASHTQGQPWTHLPSSPESQNDIFLEENHYPYVIPRRSLVCRLQISLVLHR